MTATPTGPFRTKTADLGLPNVSLDGALQLAAELEDVDRVRAMQADDSTLERDAASASYGDDRFEGDSADRPQN